jgi:hypothetical protein
MLLKASYSQDWISKGPLRTECPGAGVMLLVACQAPYSEKCSTASCQLIVQEFNPDQVHNSMQSLVNEARRLDFTALATHPSPYCKALEP